MQTALTNWKAGRKWLLIVLALAAAYYAAARLGLILAFAATNASPVWPPSGIALGTLLILGYRYWPGVFLGAFAANFATFAASGVVGSLTTTAVSAAIAGGNTLETLCAVFLLRRIIGQRGYFTQPFNVYKFVLIAGLASSISAGIGTASLLLGGVAPGALQWTVLSTWWLGDVVGMLILTPFLVAWSVAPAWQQPAVVLLEMAISAAVLVLILAFIFGQHYAADMTHRSLAYFVLPCVGWAAYRHGRRGVTLALLIVAGAAVWGTTRGLGPFATGTLQDSLATLEIFIALNSIVGLVLAADLSERKRYLYKLPTGKSMLPLMHWATLFICLALTVVAWHFISSSTEKRAQDRFNFIAEDIKQRIHERMGAYRNLLLAGRALFAASQSVDRDEWQNFVARLDTEQNFPGVQGIGYARKIAHGEKDAAEQMIRSDGFADFRIWPPGDRSEYFPVIYIEPLNERNRRAFGYDMFAEKKRHDTMERARDSGEAAMSGKLRLVQETVEDVQTGFIIYNPVYRNGALITTREERIAALQGYVYTPFRMNNLMRDILGSSAAEFSLSIFEMGKENDATLMYSSQAALMQKSVSDYPNAFTTKKTLAVLSNEQGWTLRITSLPAFEATIDRQKSLIVLIAGTLISLLFFGMVGSLNATREKAQALADDMTVNLKAANLTLRQSEQELHVAIEKAESASRAKSEFVANMSHELRTPLNAVLGITYLLGNSGLSRDQKKYLDMIRTSGQSLLSILNDILDFSKIEAGHMELAPAPFRLNDVLNAIATIMNVNAGQKNLELAILVEPDIPVMLMGDALRLQQILINLTGNSIKFTQQGEVILLADIVEQQADRIVLRFSIRDTGIGMSAEQQARLFSAFTQADSSITRRFGGTGLGLTICKRLIELMGGTITVVSELNKGSEFSITVPLQVIDQKVAEPHLPDRLHILIADTHQATRDALIKIAQSYKSYGWRVDSADSGIQAMAYLRVAKNSARFYDAILLDWKIDDISIADIHKLYPNSGIPLILMVNAMGHEKFVNAKTALQATAVLTKPITSKNLGDTLREIMLKRGTAMDSLKDTGKFPAARPLQGIHLLLAEDNALNQVVASGMLKQAGATIDIVENGQQAVDRLRQAAQHYHLVLMDVQMPVMDGFSATRLIRTELGLTLPVLAMTAGVTEAERMQCIDAGMDDFIGKPLDAEQMCATISRHLPQHKGALSSAATVPAPDLSSETPILDLDALMKITETNPAYRVTMMELIQSIIEKSTAPIHAARVAWDAGNIREAAQAFHRMRGEIGVLGAPRFIQVTLAIEKAIIDHDEQQVMALFKTAEAELQTTLGVAQTWLAKHAMPAETTLSQTWDPGQIRELRTLLMEKNIAACELYTVIRPALLGRLQQNQVLAIDAAMSRLDFDAALHLLDIQEPPNQL